jgi:hypothetical protein
VTRFRELCADCWVYGACPGFVAVEQQLTLYRVQVGLETMVHADRTKTCLKITSYTNVEIQHNVYHKGVVCLLRTRNYGMKTEKNVEQLT